MRSCPGSPRVSSKSATAFPTKRATHRGASSTRYSSESISGCDGLGLVLEDVSCRQPEEELGPMPGLAPERQVTMHQPREPPADAQAEPRALILRGLFFRTFERLEHRLDSFGRDPGPIVFHPNVDPRSSRRKDRLWRGRFPQAR